MLWQKIMISPIKPIVFGEAFIKKPRMINPKPMAAITSKIKVLNLISKNNPKLTTVNSSRISHSPLFSKKFLVSGMLFFFLKERYAEVPARKTKIGAHK